MKYRKKLSTVVTGCFLFLTFSTTIAQKQHPLEGRWDLEVAFEGKTVPSWLEVRHSGHATLVGRFLALTGSARPVSEVKIDGDKFSFSVPRQWEPEGSDLAIEGVLADEAINGTLTYVNGNTYPFTGTPAPDLPYNYRPIWAEPIELFDKKDLTNWHTDGENSNWVVEEGILKSTKKGANLISDQKFTDFKLETEFRYPEGSNSGIYLRGRYEVQIADNKGLEPMDIYFGGIYGFLEPNENAARDAGEWQNYEITLIGRRVTVIANGKVVINDQTIPGITGGALDSKEGEAGPFMIQGDHGAIEFRSFVITPIYSEE